MHKQTPLRHELKSTDGPSHAGQGPETVYAFENELRQRHVACRSLSSAADWHDDTETVRRERHNVRVPSLRVTSKVLWLK